MQYTALERIYVSKTVNKVNFIENQLKQQNILENIFPLLPGEWIMKIEI